LPYLDIVVVSTASMRVLVEVSVVYGSPTGPHGPSPYLDIVVVSMATNMMGFVARVTGELKMAVWRSRGREWLGREP